MGNVPRVPNVETICCISEDAEVPELVISADLAQDLLMYGVPVHGNATLEEERAEARLKASKKNGSVKEEQAARRQLLAAVQHDDAPGVLQFVADGFAAVDLGEALRLAAGRGSVSVVRELVPVGLSVNDGCEGSGFSPLQLAAAGGHAVVCELLLDALADVHKKVDGITALSLAHKMGNVEVEEVIQKHAALLMKDQRNAADEAAGRYVVLPRVSASLSEAVLQADPRENSEEVSQEIYSEEVDSEVLSTHTSHVTTEVGGGDSTEEAPVQLLEADGKTNPTKLFES